MNIRYRAALVAALFLLPATALADSYQKGVSGSCPGAQPVGFDVVIDFTPTGGDFSAGTGTAEASFTLENISGLYDFTSGVGNPVATAFYFNLPPGVTATYLDASILAGSSIYSTGTTVNGFPIPAGCQTLGSDATYSNWYELAGDSATGHYGIFTNGFETSEGIKAGLVDPDVIAACALQGEVYSPLVVAGQVRFRISLSGLGEELDSAVDFQSLCTERPELQDTSAFGAKFQGTGPDGEESCFIGDPCAVPTRTHSWGELKSLH